MGAGQSVVAMNGPTPQAKQGKQGFTSQDVDNITQFIQGMTEKGKSLPEKETEMFLRVAMAVMDNLRMQLKEGKIRKKQFYRLIERMADGPQDGIGKAAKALDDGDGIKLPSVAGPPEAANEVVGVPNESEATVTSEGYRMMPRREYYEPMGFNVRN